MKKRQSRAITKSRTTPQIFVLGQNQQGFYGGPRYCRASLQNNKGYVYLLWRDGEKVNRFYLGKAPRTSTTAQAQLELAGSAAGRRDRKRPRSTKKRHPVAQKAGRTRRGTKG